MNRYKSVLRSCAPATLVILAALLVCCSKAKGTTGAHCGNKTDCADGYDCYVIGIRLACYTDKEAQAMCKADSFCQSSGKCRAAVEDGMGLCR
jgi:hypothetical protein